MKLHFNSIYFTIILCTLFFIIDRQAIAEYEPKYNTIGHMALRIECEAYGKIPNYEDLDNIISKVAEKLELKNSYSRQDALNTLDTLSQLLFQNKFVYVDRRSSLTDSLVLTKLNDKDIEKILNPKEKEYVTSHPTEQFYRADCFSKSFLFVSIGEALGLPIHAALAPRHVFVRWHFPDGPYINWETTSNKSFPDSFYIENRKISAESVKNGVYLKSLSTKEMLGMIYDNISRYFAERKLFDKALYFLDKALEYNPVQVSAYDNKGIIFGRMGKYDTALGNFNKAIELNPLERLSHTYRGLTWSHKGDYEKAFDDFSKAIEIDPEFIETYLRRGDTYMKISNYDKAATDYTIVLQKDPKQFEAYFNRGLCRLAEGRRSNDNYRKAIEDLTTCIELRPSYVLAYLNRALAYEKLGFEKEAKADREEAKKWESYNKRLAAR